MTFQEHKYFYVVNKIIEQKSRARINEYINIFSEHEIIFNEQKNKFNEYIRNIQNFISQSQ